METGHMEAGEQYGEYAGMHTPDGSQLSTGMPIQAHSPSLTSASPQPLLGTPRSPSATESTPTSPMMQNIQYVMQPDGTQQPVIVQPDGTHQPVIVQPDVMHHHQQQQVIVQPDGTQVIIQPDGTQLIMQSGGMQSGGMQSGGPQYIMGGGGQQFVTAADASQQYAVPPQQPPPYPVGKPEATPPAGAPVQTMFSRPFFEEGRPTPKFWILIGAVIVIALAIGLGVGLGTKKKTEECWSKDTVSCLSFQYDCEIMYGDCLAYYCSDYRDCSSVDGV